MHSVCQAMLKAFFSNGTDSSAWNLDATVGVSKYRAERGGPDVGLESRARDANPSRLPRAESPHCKLPSGVFFDNSLWDI